MLLKKTDLSMLQNIGKTVEHKLNEVGIYCLDDLSQVGPAQAYRLMQEQNPRKLPLCYYLYSLQGAIMGVHWDSLPEYLKDELRKEAEL